MSKNISEKQISFVFFGTSEFAVKILEKLVESGYVPGLVVTTPDKPQGRKMILTPPPVKVFAEKNNLKIIQPEKLKPELFINSNLEAQLPSHQFQFGSSTPKFKLKTFDLFVVAAYGKIIPKSVLEIPKYGTLNVHPSLLPKFRGPSPIQSFILSGEEKTGVSIILLDKEVDHGPILSQKELEIRNSKHETLNKSQIQNLENIKLNSTELSERLAELGGQMLVEIIQKWINGKIKTQEQIHDQATFTEKIEKKDGLVDLEKDSPELIYKKFLAFQPWPGIYYFTEKNGKKIRIIITDVKLQKDKLVIKKLKPEGKKEMNYSDFLKGI